MFCGECGAENPGTNQFCRNCGKPLKKPQSPAAPVQPVAGYQPASLPPVPPVGGSPPHASPPVAPPGYALVPVASSTEKLLTVAGIVGFVVGLISLFRYPYLCGILAIILGSIVVYKSKNRMRKGVIIAVLGLILGFGSIIVDLFYFTFFPVHEVSLMFFWLIP